MLLNDIISEKDYSIIINIIKETNCDIYKSYIVDENLNIPEKDLCLYEVLTLSEAADIYNISHSTLKTNLSKNIYRKGELRKSGSTWLITRKAIKRLYLDNYPKNLEKLLNSVFIPNNKINIIIDHFIKEYPKSDIYNSLKIRVYNSSNFIFNVLTFAEACEMYNLGRNTLRKNIDYNRYKDGEIRQSKSIWLIKASAMKRLYEGA